MTNKHQMANKEWKKKLSENPEKAIEADMEFFFMAPHPISPDATSEERAAFDRRTDELLEMTPDKVLTAGCRN